MGLIGLTGAPLSEYPEVVGGPVNAVVPDDDGGFYIGGGFEYVGGEARSGLAHITGDRTLDPSFDPGLTDEVNALALADDKLIAGTEAGLVAFDLVSGLPQWTIVSDGGINAIEVVGGTAYVGGSFEHLDTEDRNRLAAIDVETGDIEEWDPGADWTVYALEAAGDMIYVGGAFTELAGGARQSIGAVDASSGELVEDFDPGMAGTFQVNALHVLQGVTLVVGGDFTEIGGSTDQLHSALLDLETGEADEEWPGSPNVIRTIAVGGTNVYLGGGDSRPADRPLQAVQIGTLEEPPGWDPPQPTDNVHALAFADATLYVGGSFLGLDRYEALDFARLAPNGSVDRSFRMGPDDGFLQAAALSPGGETLYVGGVFSQFVGPPEPGIHMRRGLAAIDLSTGEVTDWNPGDVDGEVTALLATNEGVYVAGDFTEIGGEDRAGFAKLDPETGEVVESWDPDPNGGILDFEYADSTLYVAGFFTEIGGQPRSYIAALDAQTGQPTAWSPSADDEVTELEVFGDTVFAGGIFESIGGADRVGLAQLQRSGIGEATAWSVPGVNVSGSVTGLQVLDGVLYVSGGITQIGGVESYGLAAVDAQTGAPMGWAPRPLDNATSARVRTIVAHDGALHVGGNFGGIGTVAQGGYARFSAPAPPPPDPACTKAQQREKRAQRKQQRAKKQLTKAKKQARRAHGKAKQRAKKKVKRAQKRLKRANQRLRTARQERRQACSQ